MSALATQVGALAQRSIMRTARQPASAIPPLDLPRRADARQRGRPESVDAAARVPDRLVPRLRARRAVHPGRAVLDHERGHRPRARHPDGLLLAALADARPRLGAARRPARRHRRPRACCRRSSTSSPACSLGRALRRRACRDRCAARLRGARRRSGSARSGRSSRFAPAPASRSRGSSRCSSSSSSSPR